MSPVWDGVVVGAGLAGLVCAQRLRQAGYRICVLEKSRGVGGRVATRRLHGTRADHGARAVALTNEAPLAFRQQVQQWQAQGILRHWTDQVEGQGEPTPPLYAPMAGMSAIVKTLTPHLCITLNHRVVALQPYTLDGQRLWRCHLQAAAPCPPVLAKAVVLAIPAPQALELCQPLADMPGLAPLVADLAAVSFYPCLSAIAGYDPTQLELTEPATPARRWPNHPILDWTIWDHTKREPNAPPVLVLHSTPAFAQQHLDRADLTAAADQMLHQVTPLGRGMDRPLWQQIHRWRYAVPHRGMPHRPLATANFPRLVCCGDWCFGGAMADAFTAGQAAAEALLPLNQTSQDQLG